MAKNTPRSSGNTRATQSGTGGKPTPQQSDDKNKSTQGTQETPGTASTSGDTPLLNDTALKAAYDGDENFKGEPRWDELTEDNRATYARLLTELDQADDNGDDDNGDDSDDQNESEDSVEGASTSHGSYPTHDEDGFPLGTTKTKPVQWNDFSDDEKHAYVYGNTGDNNSDQPQDPFTKVPETKMGGAAISNVRPTPGQPKGLILDADEEFRFNGTKVGNMIVATEDVYRKVIPFRSKRPTYVLLVKAGTQYGESTVQGKSASISEASTKSE